jgi:uracil-DNA glycosylase family protein
MPKEPPHTAEEFFPERITLTSLKKAAADCRACDLWKTGTQTVFGEGKRTARVVFIGEQPGNQEDLSGHPFVGPAGRVLQDALDEAGIDRETAYVTNVVKHFKWEARGKLRIHKKPNAREINACNPWLEAELAVLKPEAIICLGATAAQTLLGKDFKVTKQRGEWIDSEFGGKILATVHPSSILRAPDAESRERSFREFVKDLKIVAREINKE